MRRWWYLLISVAFAGGCRGPATDSGPADKLPTSKYIRRTNAETVIVFVPGVLGDPVATWTNDTTHAYWPELLTKDPVFKDSDVFTYSYSSARTQSIDEVVSDFNLRLLDSEVFAAHKRVVFICHSVGGIVVRSYLLRYRERSAQVPLVLLLSTPSTGAAFKRLNPSRPDIGFKGTDNDYLQSLNTEWISAHLSVVTRCGYETRPLGGTIVVSPADISPLCTGQPTPIDADHASIARPAGPSDPSYTLFRTAFQEDGLKTVKPPEKFLTESMASAPVYFEIGCAETKTFQFRISPPRPLRPNERIVSVTPSIQDVNNLKDVQVRSLAFSAIDSTVTVGASGLDRDFTGNCRGGGHGRVVVTFVTTGPANQ